MCVRERKKESRCQKRGRVRASERSRNAVPESDIVAWLKCGPSVIDLDGYRLWCINYISVDT